MQFDGDKEFTKPKHDVWNKLRDASFLVECIPDAEVVGDPTESEAQCKVRPGFAFVRGTMTVTVKIVDAIESESILIALLSKGVGSSSDVEVQIELKDKNAGTQVHWTAEVTKLGGLLKAIPKGLIRGAAQKTIDELWDSVEAKLGAG